MTNPDAPKNKGGRPRKEIDYTELDRLCALQASADECAANLGMSYDTFITRLKEDGFSGFTEYFQQKRVIGWTALRRKQYELAMAGSVPMNIWLGKQYLGQADKQEVKSEGKEERNMTVTFVDPPKRG
jgi:hypothetical protein